MRWSGALDMEPFHDRHGKRAYFKRLRRADRQASRKVCRQEIE